MAMPSPDERVLDAAAQGDARRIRSSTRRPSILTPLEFGAAATLTNPARAELMARFKSA